MRFLLKVPKSPPLREISNITYTCVRHSHPHATRRSNGPTDLSSFISKSRHSIRHTSCTSPPPPPSHGPGQTPLSLDLLPVAWLLFLDLSCFNVLTHSIVVTAYPRLSTLFVMTILGTAWNTVNVEDPGKRPTSTLRLTYVIRITDHLHKRIIVPASAGWCWFNAVNWR